MHQGSIPIFLILLWVEKIMYFFYIGFSLGRGEGETQSFKKRIKKRIRWSIEFDLVSRILVIPNQLDLFPN